MQEKSQTEIRDQNGREFATAEEQKRYIYDHFANSFKCNPNEPESLDNCIENFLGPEILGHPLVNSLKLPQAEKDSLESDLTLEELDSALEGANKKSAAGLDGLNTKFISRFWNVFRVPLHMYAATVFRKGSLTASFKSSIIKLIPKKGDAHDIKKWRPISLLGCLYKVISRAVNNRLKSVINRFTSRAQKGFTNHRYIQEVLINVTEKISYCKKNNISGALPKLKGRDLMYNSHFLAESNRCTDKADSFADDNSTATLADAASLGNLKKLLKILRNLVGYILMRKKRLFCK